MPKMYVIAGGNGSGKTTIAKTLLPDYFNCNEFVNADIMAAEMSPDNIASVAISAGKKTLQLINNLFDSKINFAIETTLSGRVHKKIIQKAQARNYDVVLIYVWVKSYRISLSRVRSRKGLGGHFVPDEDVIRRYKRGLINLFKAYMKICDYWAVIDNTEPPQKLVADGIGQTELNVFNRETWNQVKSRRKRYETGI